MTHTNIAVCVQVVATEVSKASVAAARHNIEANGVTNIFLARMSSEEFVETWRVKGTRHRLAGLDWEQLSLKTLLVDPPRWVWVTPEGFLRCAGIEVGCS
jgi:tRNA/tmRNA/rRNA uracil-C5-methylase (TrmA/RlmC/RlmD family)